VEKKPEVRIELPHGLGLSDDELKSLIADWIVPRLLQEFVLETIPKKPVRSVSAEDLAAPALNQRK
jgi:hypothetical protein